LSQIKPPTIIVVLIRGISFASFNIIVAFVIPSPAARPTVYVADDDFDVLSSLRFLLETDGFEVKAFGSGSAFLDAVTSDGADCFVIDYKMPNMSGLDLAKRLRMRGIDTPIILITGYPDNDISRKAAAAGIHHVLLKPHLEDSLVAHVRGVIKANP
jgi:two-component system, LuxR family, response regulator FixJ